jgi:organic hydroperoxide reductase OsmC/OhrA
MTTKEHTYSLSVKWTGNLGEGTSAFRSYKRDHEISAPGKAPILSSSDPAFRGDSSRYNPEELLVASLSACHMLWYLHLCSEAGVTVQEYFDEAVGKMVETEEGGGHFAEVILHPRIKITSDSNTELASQLHEKAHRLCFIANSVNFPVLCEPAIEVS